jgi:preprotein translocase subunit SecD
MKRNPTRVFIFILLLLFVAGVFCLPDNVTVPISIGSFKKSLTLHSPTIDLTRFGIAYKRNFKTEYGLDLSGGTQVTLEADMSKTQQTDKLSALESAKSVIERRVNYLGVSEPVVQTSINQDRYRILVELPGVTKVDQAVAIIGQTAQLEFRELDAEAASRSATPSSYLDITKATGLTGKDLKKATVVYSQTNGEPEVSVEFTDEGSKKFADLTKKLVNQPLPIFLDADLVSSPVVKQEITGGNAVISGSFTVDTAKALALQLNAGALPVSIKVVEQRVIEASLGQDSIGKSVRAGLVGLLLVAAFMILRYGRLGVISVAGLFCYGVYSFALFRLIPVTLTLPGIAGFILTVGMAVDSNILIFERYKEERLSGKPWKMAMEQAFGKAWDSIRDANITTILTSLILFNPFNYQLLPTSGLVRGFAVTLLLGVLLSLFTGLVVTRTFIRVLYREREDKTV